VLSRSEQRELHDQELLHHGGNTSRSIPQQQPQQQQHLSQQHQPTTTTTTTTRRHRSYRDPFGQFNDLFQNDPFFAEAFQDMDDLFAKTFQEKQQQQQQQQSSATKTKSSSWGQWIANCFGIDFQISTASTTMERNSAGGRIYHAQHTRSHYYGRAQNQNQQINMILVNRFEPAWFNQIIIILLLVVVVVNKLLYDPWNGMVIRLKNGIRIILFLQNDL